MDPINVSPTDIAIIGMSGRFPGAKTISEFWDNLCAGKETLSQFSDAELFDAGVSSKIVNDKNYIKVGGILPEYDRFDNEFFSLSPRDALLLDPQYRVFLEESWVAFENAGYDILSTTLRVGVFAGAKPSNYLNYYQDITKNRLNNPFEYGFYNEISQLATRVSYEFNLTGPSVYVLTACSTSLVVIHLACQSLLVGECDMALAGAISLQAPQIAGYFYQKGMILSPDGHCRSFDANAGGTILSNGVGIVVLKRLVNALNDGDRIEAIIKVTAINNDGKRKIGFSAPSIEGQAEVISTAIDLSGIDVNTISYIEAHGTGTLLGDPIEFMGLKKALLGRTRSSYSCYIGSVKSNIGHLDVASGMAGLIKTVKSMQAKKIPATLHFHKANPELNIQDSPFKIVDQLTPWQSSQGPLRAGISSFGIGGTNAHVLLEEAPSIQSSNRQKTNHLLILSAKNKESLNKLKIQLSEYLRQNTDDVSDIAYTLQMGRHHFPFRLAMVFNGMYEEIQKLTMQTRVSKTSACTPQRIVFMFPGQGAQYVNMGYELYKEYGPFRNLIDICIEKVNSIIDFNFHDIIFLNSVDALSEKQLIETDKVQLTLFIIEYALAQFLMLLGIKPTVMIGHSLGEYVAATLAGVFTLEDAIRLVYKRSCLMQSTVSGLMLAVFMGEIELRSILPSNIAIAAVNGKDLCVVSGMQTEIEMFTQQLKDKNIKTFQLKTSHAFHSVFMEPILSEFRSFLNSITLFTPQLPYISNLTGQFIKSEEAQSPEYWVSHLRYTVKYHEGFARLVDGTPAIYIEVGPGTTLTSLATREFKLQAFHTLSSKDITDKTNSILETIGKLWELGLTIDFKQLHINERRRKVALPTYPFIRKYFWPNQFNTKSDCAVEEKKAVIQAVGNDKPMSYDQILKNIWLYYFDQNTINNNIDLFSVGGDSLTVTRLLDDINRELLLDLPISWVYEHNCFDKQLRSIHLLKDKVAKQNSYSNHWVTIFSEIKNSVPLLFIHPSRAGAEVYREIALKIGKNRTVVGINSYHLNTGDYSVRSIEALAYIYVNTIQQLFPHGHCFLAGWSMGGLIAYEIAKQMNKNIKRILSLYLIDTAVTPDVLHCSSRLFDAIKKELITSDQFLQYPQTLQKKLIQQIEVDNMLIENYHRYETYVEPVILYKAKNSIRIEKPERLHPFELEEINRYYSQLFARESNGWGPYFPKLIEVPINACHFSMLNKVDLLDHMQKDLSSRER